MSEKDLKNFIQKVKQLNKMIDSLDKIPGRRKKLSTCSTHDEVIELAKEWGYKIHKRWGEEI